MYPASFSSESFTPDGLVIEVRNTDSGTLLQGENIVRGTVLGLVAVDAGAVTVADPTFSGSGDGVLTKATPAYGVGVQEGTYKVRLIEAGSNSGQFEVRRPDGTIDGYATVAAAYDGQVKFTIADGSTDFSAAAQFSLAVTIADTAAGKYKKSVAAATDGSQTPVAIAVEDSNATAADKTVLLYTGGRFLTTGLTLGSGHTASGIKAALRDVGIYLEEPAVED